MLEFDLHLVAHLFPAAQRAGLIQQEQSVRAQGDWTCELMVFSKETQAHHCAKQGLQTTVDQTGSLELGVMLPQSLGLLETAFALNPYSLLLQQMGRPLLRSAVQSQTQQLQKAECLRVELESEMG